MNTKNICITLIIFSLLLILSACAPGGGSNTTDNPAGFFKGVWHGWIAPISLIWGFFNPVIRVKGDAAWARYRKNRRRQQIASAPIVVELHKLDQNWTVTKEDQDWPWWWHVINHTVGVK